MKDIVVMHAFHCVEPVLGIGSEDTFWCEQVLDALHDTGQIRNMPEYPTGGDRVGFPMLGKRLGRRLFVEERVPGVDSLLVGDTHRVAGWVDSQELYAVGRYPFNSVPSLEPISRAKEFLSRLNISARRFARL